MKGFLAILLILMVMLAGGVVLLTGNWLEEPEEPPLTSVSSSSQIVRQEALTPTLSLDGTELTPGFVSRGEEAAPGELSEPVGAAVIHRGEGLPELTFSQAPDQTTATLTAAGEETPLFMGTLEQLEGFTPEKSGDYTLDLWASWDGGEGGFSGLTGYRDRKSVV